MKWKSQHGWRTVGVRVRERGKKMEGRWYGTDIVEGLQLLEPDHRVRQGRRQDHRGRIIQGIAKQGNW